MPGDQQPFRGSLLLSVSAAAAAGGLALWALSRRKQVSRTQLRVRKVITDNSDAPFPHLVLTPSTPSTPPESSSNGCDLIAAPQEHPYAEVISMLPTDHVTRIDSFPAWCPPPIDATPWQWVDTPDHLQQVALAISCVEAFALDTEHNATRSYLGITCLIQISTGDMDYLIDALALHEHMAVLRPAFANPNILKVLHGGDNDTLWLQRDFHLYLVNVFDTEKACQVLGRTQRSLASLLDAFIGLSSDKGQQKSDWTVRPLSEDQLYYARNDSHYLLYIARRLHQELIAKQADKALNKHGVNSLVERAVAKSQGITLNMYRKTTHEGATTASALAIVKRYIGDASVPNDATISANGLAPANEVAVFAGCVYVLCEWRDRVARDADEGVQHILPDAAIVALSKSRPLMAPKLIHIASTATTEWQTQVAQSKGGGLWSTCDLGFLEKDAKMLCGLLKEVTAGRLDWPGWKSCCGSVPRKYDDETKFKKKVDMFSAKAPVYDNCIMLSMKGEALCHCDKRKLEWYVGKGLAERVSEDPPTIRLLFQHNDTDQKLGNNNFYSIRKANKCVGCGEEGHYLRYRVFPSCYRRHLPVHLKSHRSHDVVLVCIKCHEIAHKESEKLKRVIADEYGIPLDMPSQTVTPQASAEGEAQNGTILINAQRARSAAVALCRYRDTLSEQQRRKLEIIVCQFLGLPLPEPHTPLDWAVVQQGILVGLVLRRQRKLLKNLQPKQKQATAAVQPSACQEGRVGAGTEEGKVESGTEEGRVDSGIEEGRVGAGTEDGSVEAATAEGSVEFSRDGSSGWALEREGTMEGNGAGDGVGPRHFKDSGHHWHGAEVMKILKEEGGEEAMIELMKRFRKAFVAAVNPQHLPESWAVDHEARRDFGRHSVYRNQTVDIIVTAGSHGNDTMTAAADLF